MTRQPLVTPRAVLALALAIATLRIPGPSEAATTQAPPPPVTKRFEPVVDTFVNESHPRRSYDGRHDLQVDGAPRIRTFLKFRITGTRGYTVLGARLAMRALDGSPAGGHVLRVGSTGWDGGITWRTQPSATGPKLGSFGSVFDGARGVAELGRAVKGDGRVAFRVRSSHENRVRWASRESGRAPRLILELAPRVAAAGDIACDPDSGNFNGGTGTSDACRQMATSNLLTGGRYRAVLALGDTQYENGRSAAFAASYDPSWGRVRGITHPAVGNHEYVTPGAAGYFAYFGSAAGDAANGYYSVDVGTWHVIALNSNCTVVACDAGSAQEQWLRADLAANPAHCSLAFMHHPFYSSGQHGGTEALRDLWIALDDAGVDVVLSGHDHDYERFARQDADGNADADGVRQFVVGTGGKGLRAFGEIQANSRERNRSTFGILKLSLRPSGYRWKFVGVGGTAVDSGTTRCR